MIIVRLRAEHIPRKKKMLVARPSTFQRVTSSRQSISWELDASGEPNLQRTKRKKEADRTFGFLSGASVSRKCALPFAPRYP